MKGKKTQTWGFCVFICIANRLFCPSSFIARFSTLYWQCAVHADAPLCVCACVCRRAVCVFTVHNAVLGWQGLSGTTLTPVRMTEREQVSGKNRAICLQHSTDTQTERAMQTLTPLTESVLHPAKLQRSQRTQWNSNHKHNPTRTNQRHTEQSLKWPLLSKPLRDDLPNVKQKSKSGAEVVKQHIAQKKKKKKKLTLRHYMTYFVAKEHSQWCVYVTVHKPVDGLVQVWPKSEALG